MHLRLKSFGGQYCIAEVIDLKKLEKLQGSYSFPGLPQKLAGPAQFMG